MRWTWKFFDALLVVGAVVLGLGIWLIPNWTESPTFKKMEAAVMERRDARLAREAEQARIKAINDAHKKKDEEEGIVYFGPGGTLLPPDDPGKPAKPAGKSDQK
ncbi:MAG: hypothetical protein GC155_00755 [Alphaproteobacteria bacterium]|nr:hypothetical protein [Alphaproteobacteria bacterium]